MTASASDSAKTATITPSTINVEQDGNSKVHNNLELSGGRITTASESDCAFSPNTLINTEDGCPLVWTSSASPGLETPWSTPPICSLGDLNEEAVYSPKTHAEDQHSHARRPQPFRIEIPPPLQDWWNWPMISPSPLGSDGGHSSEASSEPLVMSPEPALRKGRKGRPPGSRNKKTILRERRRKVMRTYHEG
jgi:hypothetical protein